MGTSGLLPVSVHCATSLRMSTVVKKGVYVMKKLISLLLVVMMLFTAVSAYAESVEKAIYGKHGILSKFLKETDTNTKDIALQVEAGDKTSDLVIRFDKDNLHLVSRNNGVEEDHIQFNPTGVYLASDGNVTLLRYATVTTILEDIVKDLNSMLEEAIKSIPEEELPTNKEIKEAVNELGIVASVMEAQDQADAVTLSSAAVAFADKFKPEYILDVKGDEGSVEISLRSEAFATALAEAMDELMMNPDIAELVNRKAEAKGGKTFAKIQKDWLVNREAILEAIRSIQSTDAIDENGHWVSHFQIGEELSETKILMCDTDAWIDAENGEMEMAVALGFKDEDPLLVYELAVDPYSYTEKLTSGESMADVHLDFDEKQIVGGNILTVIEGNEQLRADFGTDYLYMKGPKGAISTTVRETWTGKIRYEVFAETAEGKEASFTVDFYQDGDSLVCELNSSESDQPAMFKLSRIDKVNIEDLSTAENINEITVEKINAELESLLKEITTADK